LNPPMTPSPVSVTLPVGPAIENVKRLLFRPFDLSKWFVIGFCAWLAYLGQRGGFNFHVPGTRLPADPALSGNGGFAPGAGV